MLAEGAVDQVLVLCPSVTIEQGLTEKFRLLSADTTLKDLMPASSKVINPRIINASNTIQTGDICIENIHATRINTKSAIEDSLTGKGSKTLVLNDEAHHLMNPTDQGLKKWKEFLLDPKYDFIFIANFSGTSYIGDDYFTDVIHRFSLRDSIEQKFVKSVRYVAEDSPSNEDERFQKIYDNHIENKTIKYRLVKPLTIIVTKDIAACERLTEKLTKFLARRESISAADAAEKVLIVTSAPEHRKNLQKLQTVDDATDRVEWITSVSMLSEGWDVKNVFQIVPHEERAFNSKLLIAQVLGRGLRIPEAYRGTQPVVTVFNHTKWSTGIKYLVDEVLEIEKNIDAYPVAKPENYDFDLDFVEYEKKEEEKEYPQEDSYDLLSKGYVSYSTQQSEVERSTTYVTAVVESQEIKKTRIEFHMLSVDEVANEVVNKLKAIDLDLGTDYSDEFDFDKIKTIINASLEKIGDKSRRVSDANLQRTLQAFGVVYRRKSKVVRFEIEAHDVRKISTQNIKKTSLDVNSLRRGSSVFWDDNSLALSEAIDKKLLEEIDDPESTLPRVASIKVNNRFNFKTPVNVVFASSEPERRFIRALVDEQNAKKLDAWIKSPDVGFYSIEYSLGKRLNIQNREVLILIFLLKSDGIF